ncbi:TolC family protein [Engelhardtia mirabilis]|uniref:Cobalt-zinc-cadmium resistance protein CzcC n=1 Tax=Engelhardtia mirabilis TaxID=2528011 RepID=A0A518BM12_9BACT|nr:Cobalt-zinc-cadmium resistance protein CzcC precursor [Planctomycetes bacterium Pla133]QDV02340.1 Cobalt-zinc-cadmium resistance protein CzcC precursor [Planctomycetes bacterium Pla86]
MSAPTRLVAGLAGCIAALSGPGCKAVDPRADFDRARALIEARSGGEAAYDPGSRALSVEELDAVLLDGLTLEEARRLALVNNRELQAAFQSIGMAHADWVQAQLLSNPSLALLMRFPTDGGRSLFEATLGFGLLELWRIPAAQEAAQRELEATVLEIARRAGEGLADAEQAYFAAVAADALRRVSAQSLELAERSAAAVEELYAAGAADALAVSLAHGPVLYAQLQVETARIEAAQARRELAKHLSLLRPVEGLALVTPLPAQVEGELDAERLVATAVEQRLDLQALELSIAAQERRVAAERRRGLGDAEVGLSTEIEEGASGALLGPALNLSLPIFDQNQAQVSRAEFELTQLVKLRDAAWVEVAQDVRSAVDRLASARRSLSVNRGRLTPQVQASLALVARAREVGEGSLLTQLELERQLLDSRRAEIVLELEAAAAATELERVTGARIARLP